MRKILFVMSFAVLAVMSSCEFLSSDGSDGPKNESQTDKFFAQARNDVSAITNPEDFMAFYMDFEQKKAQYVENNNTESVVSQLNAYNEVENAKFVEFYEPVINRVEDVVAVMSAKILKDESLTYDDIAELEASTQEMDKYEDYKLQPDMQLRYDAIVDKLSDMILKGFIEFKPDPEV